MTETMKIWLQDLYENEIEEVKGTIENTRLVMLGCDTDDEVEMFSKNIEEMEEYIEHLEELLNNI